MKSRPPEAGSAFAQLPSVLQLPALKQLLERCEFGLAVVSTAGIILEVNAALCGMFKGSRETLLGSEFDRYFQTGPVVSSRAQQLPLVHVNEETRFVDLAGEKRWCLRNSSEIAATDHAQPASLFLLIDITRQKEAELILQKAESQVQVIADRLSAMVAYVDQELRFQFVNELFGKLYQRPRQEFLGRTLREALGAVEWQHAQAAISRALDGAEAHYESYIELPGSTGDVTDDVTGDVTRISTLVKLTPDTRVSGKVRGLFFNITDVSELKRVEAMLQQANRDLSLSELNMRTLMEDSPDSIVVVSPQGEILFVNQRISEMLGYTPQALLGRSFADLVPQDSRVAYTSYFASYLLNPQMHHLSLALDLTASSGDGRSIGVDISLGPTRYNGSDVVLVTIRNISDLRLAFATKEQISAIVDASQDAIISADRNSIITYWSKGAQRLYGYSAAEIIGKSVQVLIPESGEEHLAEMRRRIELKEAISQPSVQRKHKDGSLIDVSIHIFPILDAAGEYSAIASIHRDIRELKHLEEQLRHSQRLETAGLLAGGVAHDFNNILTVIQGYCSMLLQEAAAAPGSEKSVKQIMAIDSAAQRASTLTRQLLAFSQKQRSDAQIINPASLLLKLSSVLQRALGEDISLQTQLQSSWSIKEDPANFEQIVLNLAVNARHAMPRGGSLLIQTEDVELGIQDPLVTGMQSDVYLPKPLSVGAYVKICFTDSGCGIQSQIVERIFEPFFTTKHYGEGTGLGLSVVYGVVTQNGGGISVSSAFGSGASFHVYLPRCSQGGFKQAQSVVALAQDKSKGKVLLVEDDPAVLQLTQTILESAGYTVFAELEAKKALQKNYPDIDVVLSDVVMPAMSGPEFMQQWLIRYPDTRFMYMSGYADEAMLSYTVLENLLLKPFKPAQLLEKIESIINRKSVDETERRP